jgi:hypothetical protein
MSIVRLEAAPRYRWALHSSPTLPRSPAVMHLWLLLAVTLTFCIGLILCKPAQLVSTPLLSATLCVVMIAVVKYRASCYFHSMIADQFDDLFAKHVARFEAYIKEFLSMNAKKYERPSKVRSISLSKEFDELVEAYLDTGMFKSVSELFSIAFTNWSKQHGGPEKVAAVSKEVRSRIPRYLCDDKSAVNTERIRRLATGEEGAS